MNFPYRYVNFREGVGDGGTSLKAHIMLHEREESLMCPEYGDEFSLQVCQFPGGGGGWGHQLEGSHYVARAGGKLDVLSVEINFPCRYVNKQDEHSFVRRPYT